MKTLFFTLFIALVTPSVFAEEMWVTQKSKLPSEFTYLLEALQKTEFTANEKRSLSSTIKELDAEFSLMTKEEIFLIVKGEIYKSLLTYYRGSSDQSLEVDQRELLQKALQEKGPKLNAFALWLMIAIKTDVDSLLGHPDFAKIKLGAKNKDLLRLKKKMTVITPWVQNFLSMEIDEFHNELRPVLWDIFGRIENSARLFVLMGRIDKKKTADSKLAFFSLKEVTGSDIFPELDNWLKRQTAKKESAKENAGPEWKPKEENYVAPKVLPKPIDDWLDQSDWNSLENSLLKAPETSTNTPKALPKPVDDWILDD